MWAGNFSYREMGRECFLWGPVLAGAVEEGLPSGSCGGGDTGTVGAEPWERQGARGPVPLVCSSPTLSYRGWNPTGSWRPREPQG